MLFHVEDTGSGISEEHRQSIFDRFVKLNSFAQGTGLGLSISKSIVEQMGGRIGVESEVGRGSRFWFTIPAVTCDAPEKKGAAPAPRPAAVHGDGRLPRLLVAEDTDSNYLLVSLMLPEAMEEKDLKELMRAVDGACVRYGTAVIGGHTEVTDGVLYPVLTVTAAGGTTRAGLFDPSCVTADLDLVVTKGIALGAVSYLAKTRRDELLTRFSPGFIHGAADFSEDYSVCREAEIAIEHGVAAMQDLSEGGVFGALWELSLIHI